MLFGNLPATIEQCNYGHTVSFFGWPIGYVSPNNTNAVAVFKIKPKPHAHNIPR